MRGAVPPLPQYAFMAWCLVKHRDNFTFTFKWIDELKFNDDATKLSQTERFIGMPKGRIHLEFHLF
jgi:hypothetical protein